MGSRDKNAKFMQEYGFKKQDIEDILLDLNNQTITNANNYYVNNLTNDNIGTQTTISNFVSNF